MDRGHYDFAIVGAGIAGASAAYELSALGSVLLLEREGAPGYHSTGRSAAQYVETYGPLPVRRLTRASRAFYDAPPDGFGDRPLLSPRPAMRVARADQLDELERMYAEMSALTTTARWLRPDQALALVPALRADYVGGAMIEPEAMDIDVHALHQGYLRGARRRGAELAVDHEVTGCGRCPGGWEVSTRCARVQADLVIDAAGAWCDEVARAAGVAPIGLQPRRRTAFTFDPPAGLDPGGWPLVIDVGEQFYFKPDAGRILGSPADEAAVPPCDVQPEEIDVALGVDRIERATTLEVRRIAHRWAGLRSFVADRSPVIGMDADAPGFFWLAGQGGYGIQTAPAVARAAAGLIGNGALPEALRALGLTAEQLAPGRLRGSAPAA